MFGKALVINNKSVSSEQAVHLDGLKREVKTD